MQYVIHIIAGMLGLLAFHQSGKHTTQRKHQKNKAGNDYVKQRILKSKYFIGRIYTCIDGINYQFHHVEHQQRQAALHEGNGSIGKRPARRAFPNKQNSLLKKQSVF